jgi:predicted transposase YbfD/YdcC
MLNNVFVEIFSKLKDPRVERTRKHLFLDIIGLSLFAVLAGAQCYTEIEDFCRHHQEWLKNYFELPNGIPCHDTFSRVFSAIPEQSFQDSFFVWLKAVIQYFPENIIPIDGKSIRASKRVKPGLKALHVVSAWSCANGISLGQIRVDDKTNEITVIPDILKKLCLQGAIVTLDAMGCQKQIAAQIIDQKGDYVLRVKANQAGLLEDLECLFRHAQAIQYQSMVFYEAEDEMNNDHGRIESRRCHTLSSMYLPYLKESWKGIKSFVAVLSERETHEEKTAEYRYYISSIEANQPQRILNAIRQHWQIENNLHWLLDVAYREDQSRIRDENSALNMAWLRKTALGLLKRATHFKGSIRRKQLALWAKPQYLLDIVKV